MTSAADTPVSFNPKQPGTALRQIEGSSISLKSKNGAAGSKFFKTAGMRNGIAMSNIKNNAKKLKNI
jgi:hypothetical protein